MVNSLDWTQGDERQPTCCTHDRQYYFRVGTMPDSGHLVARRIASGRGVSLRVLYQVLQAMTSSSSTAATAARALETGGSS